MPYIVMAYIVMAYIAMAHIVMASIPVTLPYQKVPSSSRLRECKHAFGLRCRRRKVVRPAVVKRVGSMTGMRARTHMCVWAAVMWCWYAAAEAAEAQCFCSSSSGISRGIREESPLVVRTTPRSCIIPISTFGGEWSSKKNGLEKMRVCMQAFAVVRQAIAKKIDFHT